MRTGALEIRHGAEQYTGYLEFIFYGHHLDRAVPRIPEAVYCLTPSLLEMSKRVAGLDVTIMSVTQAWVRILGELSIDTTFSWICIIAGVRVSRWDFKGQWRSLPPSFHSDAPDILGPLWRTVRQSLQPVV